MIAGLLFIELKTYGCGIIWSIGSAPVHAHLCWLAAVEALLGADQWLVGKWNAKGLGLTGEAALAFSCEFLGLNT